MSEHNLPTTPGLYWASEHPMLEEWELIARVWGQPPFMGVTIWNYLANRLNEIQSPAKIYYGPKIEIPRRDPRERPLKEDYVTDFYYNPYDEEEED